MMNTLKRIFFFLIGCFFCIQLIAQPTDTIDNRKKIGLVLSGGGAKGFAHVGVLKVLEEKNIIVDYIAGTSMGAVVGGFYAMGYSALEIDSIIRQQNWEKIFVGELDRGKIPLYERKDIERYILSFPIGQKGIELPEGVIREKNILTILSQTAKHYNSSIDFKKDLVIPYFCIATNLETGEEVLLDKGNLPEAIYASMAIPAVLSPLEIDGKLLVDGGIVNNFPVLKMKEMGADIIIGVDVQHGIRKRKEIKSLADIINQLISLSSKEDPTKIKACDIYIKPDMKNYSASDFDLSQELIVIGEKTARIALLDIVGSRDTTVKQPKDQFPDTYMVREIIISGLPRMTTKQFTKVFNISLPHRFTDDEIAKLIQKIYERYNLTSLSYNFEGDQKDILHFKAKEKEGEIFNIGFHFDRDQDMSLLLNASFYNFIANQSKLSVDVIVARNPRLTARYDIQAGKLPHLTLTTDVNNYDIEMNDQTDILISGKFSTFKLDLNTSLLIKNSFSLGGGVRFEHYNIKQDLNDDEPSNFKRHEFFTNIYGFIEFDTFDDKIYPKTGVDFYSELKMINKKNLASQTSVLYFDLKRAISLSNKFTILPSLYGRGILSSDTLPDIYDNFLSGNNLSSFFDHHIPFIGSKFLQFAEDKTTVIAIDFRFELWKNHYIMARGNLGLSANKFKDILDKRKLTGFGLTYSYKSLLGPIELTLSKSNIRKKPQFYMNIGFWF